METERDVYFSELIEELSSELSIYKEFLALAEKKTGVLVKGDVKTLSEITGIEQNLVLKLGRIEERRLNIVKRIAASSGKDIKDIGAEFFEKTLSSDELGRFKSVSCELKRVLSELKQKNSINEKLIRRALDYIRFSLEVITEAGKDVSVYDARGNNSGQGALRVIDKKA